MELIFFKQICYFHGKNYASFLSQRGVFRCLVFRHHSQRVQNLWNEL